MQVRLKVCESNNGQRIGHAEAIAGDFPPDDFKLFHAWLKKAPFQSVGNQPLYSFCDICEFIRCEIVMRVMGISVLDMRYYGVSDNAYMRETLLLGKIGLPLHSKWSTEVTNYRLSCLIQ